MQEAYHGKCTSARTIARQSSIMAAIDAAMSCIDLSAYWKSKAVALPAKQLLSLAPIQLGDFVPTLSDSWSSSRYIALEVPRLADRWCGRSFCVVMSVTRSTAHVNRCQQGSWWYTCTVASSRREQLRACSTLRVMFRRRLSLHGNWRRLQQVLALPGMVSGVVARARGHSKSQSCEAKNLACPGAVTCRE